MTSPDKTAIVKAAHAAGLPSMQTTPASVLAAPQPVIPQGATVAGWTPRQRSPARVAAGFQRWVNAINPVVSKRKRRELANGYKQVLARQYDVDAAVLALVSASSTPDSPIMLPHYYNFGRKLDKMARKNGCGLSVTIQAQALKDYWAACGLAQSTLVDIGRHFGFVLV